MPSPGRTQKLSAVQNRQQGYSDGHAGKAPRRNDPAYMSAFRNGKRSRENGGES